MAQDREFGYGGLARPMTGPDRVQPETSASYPTAEEAAREAVNRYAMAEPLSLQQQDQLRRLIQRAIDAAVAPVEQSRKEWKQVALSREDRLEEAHTAAGELWAALDNIAKHAASSYIRRLAQEECDKHAAYAPKGERS